jgi:hypothetical protein
MINNEPISSTVEVLMQVHRTDLADTRRACGTSLPDYTASHLEG